MNRQWTELRGTLPNIRRCLRQISRSGAKIVRAGRENIFVEVHRDELKWLQNTATTLSLSVSKTQEPNYTTALCGAFSINAKQHQVACARCAKAKLVLDWANRKELKDMSQQPKRQYFRTSDRARAIRAYAIENPTAALDTFIKPLEEQGWALGLNRKSQLKNVDNALRNHRGGPGNIPGYLLKGRPYTGSTEPAEVVEVFEGVRPDPPGIDVAEAEAVDVRNAQEIEALIEAVQAEVDATPEPILINTLDGLVQMAQERADEHMTLAAQWETIKGTIMSLVFESQESEEKLRSAQAEVAAAQRKLNAVIAAMSDTESGQG